MKARSSPLKFSSPACPANDSLKPKKAMMMSGLSWASHSSGVGMEPLPVCPEPQRSFASESGGWNFSAPGNAHGERRAEWGRKPGVLPSSHMLRMKRFLSGCRRWRLVSNVPNCIMREPRPLPMRTMRESFSKVRGAAVLVTTPRRNKRNTFMSMEIT